MDEAQAKPPASLQEAFGPYVELLAEEGGSERFRIMAEFRIGDAEYAALQSDAMRREDEVEFFRVVRGSGEPQLETIEDDEEWETVAEAYDDLQFPADDRP